MEVNCCRGGEKVPRYCSSLNCEGTKMDWDLSENDLTCDYRKDYKYIIGCFRTIRRVVLESNWKVVNILLVVRMYRSLQ